MNEKMENKIELIATLIRISDKIQKEFLVPDAFQIQGTNQTGDPAKKIDLKANEIFIQEFQNLSDIAGVMSEEMTEPLIFGSGKFLAVFDPIDGSANGELNGNLGSIFALIERKDSSLIAIPEEFLVSGESVVCAGFLHFGLRTVLVLADQSGVVEEFMISGDGTTNEIFLSASTLKMPQKGPIVSVNAFNFRYWDKPVQDWMNTMLDATRGITARYSGCLVSDFHRVLKMGGIFVYPTDRKNKKGKLRLIFEGIPLAFISKTAGGTSSNGLDKNKTILQTVPSSHHQQTGLVLGSVENVEDFFRG
jgi:fructose-1,6-bisphosphatase I